jgi:hypothetical protein
VNVLNFIDDFLSNFITTWRDVAILSDDIISVRPSYNELSFREDCESVKILLSFSAMLLSNAVEKGLYNSVEVSRT